MKKELLQKLKNISEECSEIDENSQSESEDESNNFFESDHEFDSVYDNHSSGTNDEEDYFWCKKRTKENEIVDRFWSR